MIMTKNNDLAATTDAYECVSCKLAAGKQLLPHLPRMHVRAPELLCSTHKSAACGVCPCCQLAWATPPTHCMLQHGPLCALDYHHGLHATLEACRGAGNRSVHRT